MSLVGAIIGSALIGAFSSKKSSDAQQEGISQASNVQREINADNIAANKETLDKLIALNKKILADQREETRPWREVGVDALDYIKRGFDEGWLEQETVQGLDDFDFKKFNYGKFDQRQFSRPDDFQYGDFQAPSAYQSNKFNAPDKFQYEAFKEPDPFQYDDFEAPDPYQRKEFEFEADPGYQFRKEEMERSVAARAAQRGRNASPATDKVMSRYVGGLASQEYGNAFNRYLATTDRDYQEYSDDYSRNRFNYDQDRGFSYGVYSDDYSRKRSNYDKDRGFAYGQYSDNYSRDRSAFEGDRAFDYGQYSDDYSRNRFNYDQDRSFAYGNYADTYARDWNDFQYGEDRRYDTYEKTGRFEADQHWKQQGLDYANYLDTVNADNAVINSRNASRTNMLNTAMNLGGVGQNASNQNNAATSNYGANVTNAFNSMNSNNNASRTNTGNNMSNYAMAYGQANPYSGYANSINRGIENWLLYDMYSNPAGLPNNSGSG